MIARTLVEALLPKRSSIGGWARDGYRWLTLSHARSKVALVLEALALSRPDLFFIQIGSNDGDHADPLRRFIVEYNWAGILVEPVPYVFERLARNYRERPSLICEPSAIACQDGTADFYHLAKSDDPLPAWYDQLGSFSLEQVLKHADGIPNLRERVVTLKVPCLTLESLYRKHVVQHLDLIHIDAEGYDFEIIRLIDFRRRAPTVLLFEHIHLSAADRDACRRLLEVNGYWLTSEGLDTLCVQREAVSSPMSRLGRAWRLAAGMHSTSASG